MNLRRAKAREVAPAVSEQREILDENIRRSDASRVGVYGFATALFCVVSVLVGAATFALLQSWAIVLGVVAGFLAAATIRVAPQWERVALLRMGKFRKVAGPGLYLVIPFVDSVAMHMDIRTISSAFNAEQALTAELVSVDIEAILFWVVWDPKKACLEVANYPRAVLRSAQTAIRDAVGQVNLEDLSMRRRQLDHELQVIMSAKCEASASSAWRFAISGCPRNCRTLCRGKRRPPAKGMPAWCWLKWRRTFRRCTTKLPICTQSAPRQ